MASTGPPWQPSVSAAFRVRTSIKEQCRNGVPPSPLAATDSAPSAAAKAHSPSWPKICAGKPPVVHAGAPPHTHALPLATHNPTGMKKTACSPNSQLFIATAVKNLKNDHVRKRASNSNGNWNVIGWNQNHWSTALIIFFISPLTNPGPSSSVRVTEHQV